jgi:hypothetical protein
MAFMGAPPRRIQSTLNSVAVHGQCPASALSRIGTRRARLPVDGEEGGRTDTLPLHKEVLDGEVARLCHVTIRTAIKWFEKAT